MKKLIFILLLPILANSQNMIGNPRDMFFSLNATYVAPTVWDTTAQRFFDSTGITNSTQKLAVNQVATSLKDSSLWTGTLAIYPFVGGTSTTHAFNLKNPSTFKLTFVGTPTQSSAGFTSASGKYAKTGIIPSIDLSLNTAGVSHYTASTTNGGGVSWGTMGTAGVGTRMFYFPLFSTSSYQMFFNGSTSVTGTGATLAGFHSVNRVSSSQTNIYKNGVLFVTSGTSTSGSLSDKENYIGCYNNNGTATSPSTETFSIVIIKNRFFTATEERMLYNIVLAYETALGRQ